jgi:hypothetical protein
MIDISDLKHHIAGRDAQGRPVLVQKPLPAEFSTASAVSRLSYRRAVENEEQEVVAAAKYATMPDRPVGYRQMSAASRRAWWILNEPKR